MPSCASCAYPIVKCAKCGKDLPCPAKLAGFTIPNCVDANTRRCTCHLRNEQGLLDPFDEVYNDLSRM